MSFTSGSTNKLTYIYAPVSKSGGGIYQYSESLVKATRDIKGEIRIISNDHNHNFINSEDEHIPTKNIGLFTKVGLWLSFLINYLLRIQVFLFRRIELPRSEILVSPVINPYLALYSAPIMIFTLHDLQEIYYPENFSLKYKVLRRIILTWLTKSADFVLCEHKVVAESIKRNYPNAKDKVRVCTAPAILKCKHDDLPYSIVDRRRVFFYPAATWRHKNHLTLIKAFKEFLKEYPDFKLICTGSKTSWYTNIEDYVKEHALEHAVNFKGYIGIDELCSLYKSSFAVLIPSLFESISIPVLEAMESKTLVAGSNIPGIISQLDKGKAGILFNGSDSEEILKVMHRIVSLSEEQYIRYVQNASGEIKKYSEANYELELKSLLEA
jgi:glycosyltransferase involved in cell wall biosynthesis